MRSTDETRLTPPPPTGVALPPARSEREPQARAPSWPRIDPELAGEIVGAPWEYPWELAPGIHAPARGPLARQTAWVREAMIEPYALDGLALGDARVALDLNCGEGHLAHRLLDWGARRVVAVSDDVESLHRARLIRKHFAHDPDTLDIRANSELDPTSDPDFDVVVAVPLGDESLIETAAARCRSVFVLECPDADADRVAAATLAAGFSSVERLEPPTHAVSPFLLGRREILVARKRVEL